MLDVRVLWRSVVLFKLDLPLEIDYQFNLLNTGITIYTRMVYTNTNNINTVTRRNRTDVIVLIFYLSEISTI